MSKEEALRIKSRFCSRSRQKAFWFGKDPLGTQSAAIFRQNYSIESIVIAASNAHPSTFFIFLHQFQDLPYSDGNVAMCGWWARRLAVQQGVL